MYKSLNNFNDMEVFSIKLYRTIIEYTNNGKVKVVNKTPELTYPTNAK